MERRKRSIADLLIFDTPDGQAPDWPADWQEPDWQAPDWRAPKRINAREVEHNHVLLYPLTSIPFKSANPVLLQQPSSLLTFSYTSGRTLEFNNSALRYYVDPPTGAELRYGYERWIKRPEERGRLDGLLQAVTRAKEKMDASGGTGSGAKWLRDVSVVSWRGVMTKILTAPYEDRDGWEMNVMVLDGTLYLEEHMTDAKLAEKEDMKPHHRLQSYFGYAFESYCTTSTPGCQVTSEGRAQGWGGDVDTNVQWCSVVKTKLGDMRMVVGGEVDCVRDKFTGQPNTFVELKTSLVIRGPQDEARFEKKLLKFFFQSFLLGVPEIVVGFRTPSGQLAAIQSFKTIQLPRMVRDKPDAWDPRICLDWGHQFLAYLKSVILSPDAASGQTVDGSISSAKPGVWRVKFTPRSGINLSILDEEGVRDVEAGEDRIGFLPRWYFNNASTAQHPAEVAETLPTASAKAPAEEMLSDSRDDVVKGWRL